MLGAEALAVLLRCSRPRSFLLRKSLVRILIKPFFVLFAGMFELSRKAQDVVSREAIVIETLQLLTYGRMT